MAVMKSEKDDSKVIHRSLYTGARLSRSTHLTPEFAHV